MNKEELINNLNTLIPDPKCELNYKYDYELLIAVMLSSQCKDSRVNIITKDLFSKYNLSTLASSNIEDIKMIIKPLGNYQRKSYNIIEIAKHLINDYNGIVPNDQKYLESLPGVGHKTANVVLSELFNVPTIAVDTHVERVSKRLKLVNKKDDVIKIEKKLKKYFEPSEYNRINHQLLLFGRYYCKSRNPNCNNCPFNCKEKL